MEVVEGYEARKGWSEAQARRRLLSNTTRSVSSERVVRVYARQLDRLMNWSIASDERLRSCQNENKILAEQVQQLQRSAHDNNETRRALEDQLQQSKTEIIALTRQSEEDKNVLGRDSSDVMQVLERFCRLYWPDGLTGAGHLGDSVRDTVDSMIGHAMLAKDQQRAQNMAISAQGSIITEMRHQLYEGHTICLCAIETLKDVMSQIEFIQSDWNSVLLNSCEHTDNGFEGITGCGFLLCADCHTGVEDPYLDCGRCVDICSWHPLPPKLLRVIWPMEISRQLTVAYEKLVQVTSSYSGQGTTKADDIQVVFR